MSKTSLENEMGSMAEHAVEFTRRFHQLNLDYTEDSLETVERVLDYYYRERPNNLLKKFFRRGPSPEVVNQMSMYFGGYTGEVIRKKWGGEWRNKKERFPGKKFIALDTPGGTVFPTDKAYNRLTYGPENSIVQFYSSLKERILNKNPNT